MQLALGLLVLLMPLAILFSPWQILKFAVPLTIAVQLLALWLSGCITSSIECTSLCATIYPYCEDPFDDNDAAPFGILLIGLLSLMLDAAVVIFRAAFRWARARYLLRAARGIENVA
jgi:hypothetical protein